MTLDDLLQNWADWSAGGKSSYPTTRLNTLMGGGVVCGGFGASMLPYGMDVGGLASVVDRCICRLPRRRKEVIVLEYRKIGTQEAKARGIGVTLSSYRDALKMARKQLKQQPEIIRLIGKPKK